MTAIDAAGSLDRSLGDLVAEQPSRASVFERHGLDYCCRGGRTLRKASLDAGLEPVAVAAELELIAAKDVAEVSPVEPAALVDHIVKVHHRYLHDELPLLAALADKVRGVHEHRHPKLAQVAALVREVRDDLVPHLAREEQVLFPAIKEWCGGQRSFPFGTLSNPVRVMMTEHDRVGELLAELRAVTDGYRPPIDACTSYGTLYVRLEHLELDTHRHVHLENNVLFPAVTSDVA